MVYSSTRKPELQSLDGTVVKTQSISEGSLLSLPTVIFTLAVLLTLCFGALILSMLAGLHIGDALLHPNPFAAYEALWPGESLASAAEVAQRTSEASLLCVSWVAANKFHPAHVSGQEITCTSFPKNGLFSAMSLSIEQDHVQALHLVSNVLPQDDLFLYWGTPDVIHETPKRDHWVLQWNRTTYQATALVREAGSVVEQVTLLTRNESGSAATLQPKS